MKAQYITNCVNSTGEAIGAMVDRARDITYKTFIKHVDWRKVSEMLGYDVHYKRGLLLKNDFTPSYYKIQTRLSGGKCEKLDKLIEKHKHLVHYDLI